MGCRDCGAPVRVNRARRPSQRCPPCYRAHTLRRMREWHQAHGLQHRYGITREDYEQQLACQDGLCGGCGLVVPACVDHDHATSRVRGLLCQKCNVTLGNISDNSATLRRLATYLDAAR